MINTSNVVSGTAATGFTGSLTTAPLISSRQALNTKKKATPNQIMAASRLVKRQPLVKKGSLLKQSNSQSTIQVVICQSASLLNNGLTPRQQRTEFPSILTQHSSSAVSQKGQLSATTTRHSQIKYSSTTKAAKTGLTRTSTRSALSRANGLATSKTSQSTRNIKVPKSSTAKDQLLSRPVLTQTQKQAKLQSSNLGGTTKKENLPQKTTIQPPVAKKLNASPPTSIKATRLVKPNHRTSSALDKSSQSNTIVNFCGDNSVQPSGNTQRKETFLNHMPYSLSTKLGSFLLKSAQSDSFVDQQQPETRNHSVGKTPFESSKPTIEKSVPTTGVLLLDQATAPRHVTLNLSPRIKDQDKNRENHMIQTVNQSYTLCTKQLNANQKSVGGSITDRKRRPQTYHPLFRTNQSRDSKDHSEDGQIQISDLEPLSHRVLGSNQGHHYRTASMADLKNGQTLIDKEQAGTISIQIQDTSQSKLAESRVQGCDLNSSVTNGDASFESPDVLEAARKRLVREKHNQKHPNQQKSACSSSIQLLPSSLIASKRTSKTIRQQILLQSAQSYMLLSSCQTAQRPNPRIQMFQQRSPVALMSASIEESLRQSKISSKSWTDPHEEDLADCFIQERNSITLDVRVDCLKQTETKTKKQLLICQPREEMCTKQTATKVEMVPKVTIELTKIPSAKTENVGKKIGTVTHREQSLQAALNEIRRNSTKDVQSCKGHQKTASLPSSDMSHLNLLLTDRNTVLSPSQPHKVDIENHQTRISLNNITALSAYKSKETLLSSQPAVQEQHILSDEQYRFATQSISGNQAPIVQDFLKQDSISNVMVTDWTEKLKDEPQNQQLMTFSTDRNGNQSRAQQCLTSMETQQTVYHMVEGGIVLTESCTDGEAVVAAETDEFYGGRAHKDARLGARRVTLQAASFTHNNDNDDEDSSSSYPISEDLPINTVDQQPPQESERQDTGQTQTENEDLILENVQNFINMAYLQQAYLPKQFPGIQPVRIQLEQGQRLLLLDMDETLVHAATTVDIEINQIYGPDARPDFYTSFKDQDTVIQIGVFKRPYLEFLLKKAMPFFQICVYTASEQMYADSILDVLDPDRTIFTKRIYRNQCLQAVIPSAANHPMSDLLPTNESVKNSRMQESQSSLNEQSTVRNLDEADGTDTEINENKTVYIKDLRVLKGVDLSRVIIVDNQLLSFALQPDNGIPISSYFYDPADAELKYVADYLLEKYELGSPSGGVPDIREVNKQQFKLSSIIEHALKAQNLAETQTTQQRHASTEGNNNDIIERISMSQEDMTGSHLLLTASSQNTLAFAGSSNLRESTEQEISASQRRQIEEQYAMHLNRGKQIRRQMLESKLNENNDVYDGYRSSATANADLDNIIDSDHHENQNNPFETALSDFNCHQASTPWQQATSILNQPTQDSSSYYPVRSHQSAVQLLQSNQQQTSDDCDGFSQYATMQTEKQNVANLYHVCGQTSTGQIIRYPLQTQIVDEVPESLETSQKVDRRRDFIKNHNERPSKQSFGAESNSVYDKTIARKLQYSTSWSHASLENENLNPQLQGASGFNMEASLESPTGRKAYLSQRQAEQQRPSTIEVVFGGQTQNLNSRQSSSFQDATACFGHEIDVDEDFSKQSDRQMMLQASHHNQLQRDQPDLFDQI